MEGLELHLPPGENTASPPPAEPLALPDAVMLAERLDAGEHGQWLFGRAAPRDGAIGALAGVVVSAAGRASSGPGALADAVARQVAAQLQ